MAIALPSALIASDRLAEKSVHSEELCGQLKERMDELGLPGSRLESLRWFPTAQLNKQFAKESVALGNQGFVLNLNGNASVIDAPNEEMANYLEAWVQAEGEGYSLLNMAFTPQVQAVHVLGSARAEAKLPEVTESGWGSSLLVFHVAKDSHLQLTIDESNVNKGVCTAAVHVILEEGAKADVLCYASNRSGTEGIKAWDYGFQLQEKAQLNCTLLEGSSAVTRSRIKALLQGEEIEANFRGVSSLGKTTQIHRFLDIQHQAPNCNSTQLFRNVLAGKSRSSLDGEVSVSEGCSGTRSDQLINTMLLGRNARIQAKPVLLIYNDDVECTHGCTCGEMDKESLFFLESRGVSPEEAKKLLLRSFIEETLDLVEDRNLRHDLTKNLLHESLDDSETNPAEILV